MAVSITMTIVNPASYGTVMAAPTAAGLTASSGYLGYEQGKPASATAIVQLSDTGSLSLKAVSEEDLIIDIQGYFKPAADGTTGGYTPVAPVRVADTRSGIGIATAKIGNGQTAQIPVSSNVAASANAVFANVTVISPAAAGSFKAGNTPISFEKATTAVGTTVPIVNGKLQITVVSGGTLDLAIDLEGYFTPSDTTTTFTPSLPTATYPDELVQEIPANSVKSFKVAGIGDIPSAELGTLATIASMRVFADDGSSGYIAAWNASDAEPHTSVANYNAAESSPANTVIFEPNEDGYVRIANHGNSSVQVELLPQGWFATPLTDDVEYEALAASDSDLPDMINRSDLYKYDLSQDTFGGGDVIENDLSADTVDQPDPTGVRSVSADANVADSIAGDPNEVWTVNGTESIFHTLQKVPSGYRLWGSSDANVNETKYRTNQLIAYSYHCPSSKSYCIIDNEIAFYLRITLNGTDSKVWHFGTTKPRRIKGATPHSGQYGYSCGVNVKNNPDHICVHGASQSGVSGALNMSGNEKSDTFKTFERRGTFGINYAMIAVMVRFGGGRTSNSAKIRGRDVCVTRDLSEFCLDSGNGK